METETFDIKVPSELIAQVPCEPRDSSKLLVIDREETSMDVSMEDYHFFNLPGFLSKGDILVFNNSRVIPARLKGHKEGSPMEEIVLLLLINEGSGVWKALVEVGTLETEDTVVLTPPELTFKVLSIGDKVGKREERLVGGTLSNEELLEKAGQVPVPPYIHNYIGDPEKYQTVYSKVKGSAAAPTAGLHFTQDLLFTLQAKGVIFTFVTLHVGVDTFMPILERDVEEHHIYSEYCEISKDSVRKIKKAKEGKKKVIAVGTTAVRVLETTQLHPYEGWTRKYIYPGYEFKVVDHLITNFHYPKSTNLVLVSAFAGTELIKTSYQHAIEKRYRFYSFGDATLIL